MSIIRLGSNANISGAVRDHHRRLLGCEQQLQGRYTIEVIDLLRKPRLAKDDQILALPTLVRRLPPPVRRIIGDLSETERVLVGLDLRPREQ